MDLAAITVKAVALTGRYDLITEAGADNGIYYYVNSAQRMLDMLLPHPKLDGRKLVTLAAGTQTATLQYLRSINLVEVFDNTALDGVPLDRIDWIEMRELYNTAVADIDQGTPIYWCPNTLALAPEQKTMTSQALAAFTNVGDVVLGDHYVYTGIRIYPPSDGAYTLQIHGEFYSPALTTGTDTSYWSVEFSWLLIMMTCYFVELMMNNRTGANEWLDQVKTFIGKLDMDIVQSELGLGPLHIWG